MMRLKALAVFAVLFAPAAARDAHPCADGGRTVVNL